MGVTCYWLILPLLFGLSKWPWSYPHILPPIMFLAIAHTRPTLVLIFYLTHSPTLVKVETKKKKKKFLTKFGFESIHAQWKFSKFKQEKSASNNLVRVKNRNFDSKLAVTFPCQMSYGSFQISGIMCHLSHITYQH